MLTFTIENERSRELEYQRTIAGSKNTFAIDFAISLLEKTLELLINRKPVYYWRSESLFDYHFKSKLLGRKLQQEFVIVYILSIRFLSH